jgi:hypothetical protein
MGMPRKFTRPLPSLKARLGSRVNNPDLEIGKKSRDFWAGRGQKIIHFAARGRYRILGCRFDRVPLKGAK